MGKHYFLIYATANDQNFLNDFSNFHQMAKYHPGIPVIDVYIAVSEVVKLNSQNQKALHVISNIISKCNWVRLNKIFIKGNIGRDFSSTQLCLEAISDRAKKEDLIMVRNRSAYGPFCTNWFIKYANLFNSSKEIGLVGNTINISGFKDRKYDNVVSHVQTYLYMSNWNLFSKILNDFPGLNETEEIGIIDNGEIALSQRIMKSGHSLLCLYWPSQVFNLNKSIDPQLPKRDIKAEVKHLPFIHRDAFSFFFVFFWRFRWFSKNLIYKIRFFVVMKNKINYRDDLISIIDRYRYPRI